MEIKGRIDSVLVLLPAWVISYHSISHQRTTVMYSGMFGWLTPFHPACCVHKKILNPFLASWCFKTYVMFWLLKIADHRSALVDLLFLKNRENLAQIFEYIFSWSECFQFKSLLLGEEVPVDNILSNVGWRPNTRNSLGRWREILSTHWHLGFSENF